MKVKHLIEYLQAKDPESEIACTIWGYDDVDTLVQTLLEDGILSGDPRLTLEEKDYILTRFDDDELSPEDWETLKGEIIDHLKNRKPFIEENKNEIL